MKNKEKNKKALETSKENFARQKALGNETRFLMTKSHHKETFEKARIEGKMDKDFIPFCKYIASTKNYFTSSCCAGRIALISLDEEESKKTSAFYRKWHRKVSEKEIMKAINDFDGEVLWFKQEPIILHLGTNTLDNARKILVFCEKCGIKRSGIKVAKEGRFIVEMVGTQNITLPIKEKGKLFTSEKYLDYLIKKANKKFWVNQELLKKMLKEAKTTLK